MTVLIPEQIYRRVGEICYFFLQEEARCSKTTLVGARFEAVTVVWPKMSVL